MAGIRVCPCAMSARPIRGRSRPAALECDGTAASWRASRSHPDQAAIFSGSASLRLRRSRGKRAFRGLVLRRLLVGLLRVGGLRPAATRDIFLAVQRSDMRRIAVEIGTADAEVLAVGVDPFPEGFGRNPALRP